MGCFFIVPCHDKGNDIRYIWHAKYVIWISPQEYDTNIKLKEKLKLKKHTETTILLWWNVLKIYIYQRWQKFEFGVHNL